MTNYVGFSNKRDFVLDQLNSYSGVKKVNSSFTLILCPAHSEKTPSGSVNTSEKYAGYFRCFGCGVKFTWDQLAVKIGLKPFKTQPPKDEFASLKFIPSLDSMLNSNVLFVNEKRKVKSLELNKQWRTIPTSLLTAVGCKRAKFYSLEYGWGSERLFFPVLINKELVGYIKARIDKSDIYPSYLNASGPWAKTHGLFPYDYSIELMNSLKSESMVLVEGPRDALKLLSLGIPAMSLLGTQGWSSNKAKLLELGGVNQIILMMDGDCAGIAATEKIEPLLRKSFAVEIIRLWNYKLSPIQQFINLDEPSKAAKEAGISLWDACNCPEKLLMRIKEKYFN